MGYHDLTHFTAPKLVASDPAWVQAGEGAAYASRHRPDAGRMALGSNWRKIVAEGMMRTLAAGMAVFARGEGDQVGGNEMKGCSCCRGGSREEAALLVEVAAEHQRPQQTTKTTGASAAELAQAV